jgi:hypothetical protein
VLLACAGLLHLSWRCRPLSEGEASRGEPVVISVKGNRVVVRNTVGRATGTGTLNLDKAYSYDRVSFSRLVGHTHPITPLAAGVQPVRQTSRDLR